MTQLQKDLQTATRHLKRSDPVMKEIIKQVGSCKIKLRRNRYVTLVRSIVSQQISGAAARTILGRLDELVSPESVKPETIAPLTIKQLKSVGLSGQKAFYVCDLTEKVLSKEVKLTRMNKLTNEEVINTLTQVKGIGVWTVQMFLMFSLGRLNVLPTGDLGIQNAIKRAYRLRDKPSPDKLRKIAKPWSPYETVACWYLWRSLELP